jgi:hypothetical protein
VQTVERQRRAALSWPVFLGASLVLVVCGGPAGAQAGSAGRGVSPSTPGAPAVAVRAPARGIWISREEIRALPMSGPAWENLKRAADSTPSPPNLADMNDPTNVVVLAKALVHARTGEGRYRKEVMDLCLQAIDTELGGKTLSLGRELAAYVIAADIVGLDRDADRLFRAWLKRILGEKLGGKSLRSTHETRPNNWGTHAGASRAAVAVYLGDREELRRAAAVFKGWLGDRSAHAGFTYGDLSWQADPSKPVGINPRGASRDGRSIDGAQPDDMRRGGPLMFPPAATGYPWEALQGAMVQAEILERAGYPAWEWEDRALLRAVQFLHGIQWEATRDDTWQVWLVNYRCGTSHAAAEKTRPGKNMGWTDWTHGKGRPAPIEIK